MISYRKAKKRKKTSKQH